MRVRDLCERAEQDIADLQRMLPDVPHALNDWWTWMQRGYPRGTGGGRSSGPSDPTYAAVAQAEKAAADAAREYEGIFDDFEAIHQAVLRLRRRIILTTTTRNVFPTEDGCTSCARVRIPDPLGGDKKVPLWVKPYEKSKSSRLCRWCHDFRNDWGVIPSRRLCELHHQQRKITRNTILELMPDLAAKARKAS